MVLISVFIWVYLFFSQLGAAKVNRDDTEEDIDLANTCNHHGHYLINAKFGKETHWLCLKLESVPSSQAPALLDPEELFAPVRIRPKPLVVKMAYGYPISTSEHGSAEGYIGDDGHFYGVLHLGKRILHADPYSKDDPRRSFGSFESIKEKPVRPRRHQAQKNPPEFPYGVEQRMRIPGVARARVCELLLLADKAFFENDANSSMTHVVQRMIHAIAQADIIFRNTDFNEDGVPDNIGFTVKYILVLTSDETNRRLFGDLLDHKEIDGRQYLMRFARLRRLSDVCLGVAFSGHAFHNKTLGLSFTSLGGGIGGAAGGLCDKRAHGHSFNTLALAHAITALEDKEGKYRVPERIAALTLAHEMGHSFGAHHDDNFPNPECHDYLMGSKSTTADARRHYEFSICSKRLIANNLNSMSYCLTEKDTPYCGNGIVETGEACDCGLPSTCNYRDACCTPRAGGALVFEEGTLHRQGCSVAPRALCHPSQGMCCNSNCQFANLSSNGIDCRNIERECTCRNKSSCRCGFGGRCMSDGTCHAGECAYLGLRECACTEKGTGGTVGAARMCGICCLLEQKTGNPVCVGAEFAARVVIENGYTLPADWPDSEYSGPNVTIQFCHEAGCRRVQLRAWYAGDVCVSLGTIGVCTLMGVCKPLTLTPRSNVFPDMMAMKMSLKSRRRGSKMKSSSVRLIASASMLVLVLINIVR